MGRFVVAAVGEVPDPYRVSPDPETIQAPDGAAEIAKTSPAWPEKVRLRGGGEVEVAEEEVVAVEVEVEVVEVVEVVKAEPGRAHVGASVSKSHTISVFPAAAATTNRESGVKHTART